MSEGRRIERRQGPFEGRERSNPDLALAVPEALVEAIALRAAEIAVERLTASTTTTNGDRWLRGAKAIGEYVGAASDRIYSLASCKPPRIPVEHDGSALVAKRSDLDAWIAAGGGKRP